GSIPPSTHRTTSSSGSTRPLSTAPPTARSRAPWSCCTQATNEVTERPFPPDPVPPTAVSARPTIPTRSALEEGEQIRVDGLCLRGGHPMGEALVGPPPALLQQPRPERGGVGLGHDLIVVPVHHQPRDVDLLEVLGEVGLGEGHD